MRDIKFKGKTIEGEWVYGRLIKLDLNYNAVDPGTYISNDAGMPFTYQIIPITAGQFIGLKDKNEIDIYEGDKILKFGQFTSTVVFKDGAFGYSPDEFSNFIPLGQNHNLKWKNGMSKKVEVVGNIHDD